MTTTTDTNIAGFRSLNIDEIEAVSGGACISEGTAIQIGNKGELEMGFIECDGLPKGVKIPYAKWTPTKPIR